MVVPTANLTCSERDTASFEHHSKAAPCLDVLSLKKNVLADEIMMNFLKAFKAQVPRWPRVSDVETVLHRNRELNSGLSQFHRKRTNPISSFNRIYLWLIRHNSSTSSSASSHQYKHYDGALKLDRLKENK